MPYYCRRCDKEVGGFHRCFDPTRTRNAIYPLKKKPDPSKRVSALLLERIRNMKGLNLEQEAMDATIEEAIEQLREAARNIWDAAQTIETTLQEAPANKWEEACKTFLSGCSVSLNGPPEECPECLEGFLIRIKHLKELEE